MFIDDFIDGLMLVIDKGEHLGIYHIGTMEEVTIEALAGLVGEYFGRNACNIVPSASMRRGHPAALSGYPQACARSATTPKWTLRDGLRVTARWYDDNSHKMPQPHPQF